MLMKIVYKMPFIIFPLLIGYNSTTIASPISSPSQLNPGATVITFDEQAVGSAEPVTIKGVTVTDNNASVVSRIMPQGWTQYPGIYEGQYFGLGMGDRGFIINFNGATVSEFGMGVFDPNYTGNILTAYDINNNALETLTSNVDPEFPVGSPGGTFSTFIGFVRPTSDIAWIELTHVNGDWLGIDNVSFNGRTSSVPEPTTMLLFGTGLAGLAAFGRRKRG